MEIEGRGSGRKQVKKSEEARGSTISKVEEVRGSSKKASGSMVRGNGYSVGAEIGKPRERR